MAGWTPVPSSAPGWTPVAPAQVGNHDYEAESKAGSGSITGDALAGVGAGAIHTVLGAYHILRMIPGVGDKLPKPSEFIESLGTAPDTMAGHIGNIGEQMGEFIVPASKLAKATEGSNLVLKMASQGAAAGGVRAAQTSGNVPAAVDAAALGAAGPAIGAGLGYGARAVKDFAANSPRLSSVIPDVVGMLSPRVGNALRVAKKVADATLPERIQAATETAAIEHSDPLLESLAKQGIFGKAYKSFADSPAPVQKIIRSVAEDMRKPADAAPIQAPPVTAVPESAPAAASIQAAQPASIAEQLRDEMLANGSITQEHLNPSVAAEESVTPEGRAALADTMRSLPQGSRLPVANAAYAGGAVDDSKLAGAVYEAAHRSDRAAKLADVLVRHGVSSEEMPDISPEHWEALAKSIGINPPSQETIVETIKQSREAENVQALHDALDRLRQSFTKVGKKQ